MFELRDVTYVYPGNTSGRGISKVTLNVHEGEWVALLGSNGSGKSTLAKHLNALLVPTQGDCVVFGMSTSDPRNVFAIRSMVSMVFQNPENQIVGTVVEEDAAFGPENLGLSPEVIESRVEKALRIAGLFEKRKKPAYTLSGGEKQRLAVAGALAMNASCLVLDESTSMLDPQGRFELLEVLRALHGEGKTIITITHRIEEMLHCDRAIVLAEGCVAWDGSISSLFARSDFFKNWGLRLPPLASLWNELRAGTNLVLPPLPTLSGMTEALCRLL